MRNQLLKLTLVLSFAFWATGLAQFAHERLEHCHGAEPGTSSITHAAYQAAATLKTDSTDHHSEADCPLCAMFASMAVRTLAPAPVLLFLHQCIAIAQVWDRLAPIPSFEQFLPSRGPPLPTSILAA